MQILPFKPSPGLHPYVLQYLVIKKDCNETLEAKMIPRNYPSIIFTSPQMHTVFNKVHGVQQDLVAGNVYFGSLGINPLQTTIQGSVSFIVAILHPYCSSMFFKEKASIFSNSIHCITDINIITKNLNERLWEVDDTSHRIAILEQYFQKCFGNEDFNNCSVHAIELIRQHSGCISMTELAKKTYTCERNLRYKFEEHIGLSPKQYSNIFRFNSFVKNMLLFGNYESIEQQALQYNYYDLSHLNKDFIRFMGESPIKSLEQNQLINTSILSI